MNIIEQLNQSLFLVINARADAPLWMITCAQWVAEDVLKFFIPALFVFLWFKGTRQHRVLLVKSVAVCVAAMGFNLIAHLLWQHPRPFMLHLGTNFLPHIAESSFPSDHMTVAFAITLPFLLGMRGILGGFLLVMALLVSWSRIYLGVHFPLDMLGAMVCAGLGYELIQRWVWPRFGNPWVDFVETIGRKIML